MAQCSGSISLSSNANRIAGKTEFDPRKMEIHPPFPYTQQQLARLYQFDFARLSNSFPSQRADSAGWPPRNITSIEKVTALYASNWPKLIIELVYLPLWNHDLPTACYNLTIYFSSLHSDRGSAWSNYSNSGRISINIQQVKAAIHFEPVTNTKCRLLASPPTTQTAHGWCPYVASYGMRNEQLYYSKGGKRW